MGTAADLRVHHPLMAPVIGVQCASYYLQQGSETKESRNQI